MIEKKTIYRKLIHIPLQCHLSHL